MEVGVMPAMVAGINNLPGWLQVIIYAVGVLGFLFFTWKGIIPHFFTEVHEFHKGLAYFRNRPVRNRDGTWRTKEPRHHFVVPGLSKVIETDMRLRPCAVDAFAVDLKKQGSLEVRVSHRIDISVNYRVIDVYRAQTKVTNVEQRVKELLRSKVSEVLYDSDGLRPSNEQLTEAVRPCVEEYLAEFGVELVYVDLTSFSMTTVNHFMLDQQGKPTMALLRDGEVA